MHDMTRILLAASAPTLRAALPAAKSVEGKLNFGDDVLTIGGHRYRADALFQQVEAVTKRGRVEIKDLQGGRAELTCEGPQDPIVYHRDLARISLAGLALAAPSVSHRNAELARMLGSGWLGRRAEAELRRRSKLRRFRANEITELQRALNGTIEGHLDNLRVALRQKSADFRCLVWKDRAGLELLVGAVAGDHGSAAAETARKAISDRFASNRQGAMAIALAASVAPGWTPSRLPPKVNTAGIFDAACPGGRLGNPFAVAAALEVLATKTGDDPQTIQLLDTIEAQFDTISDRLSIFSGALMVSLATLSTAPHVRDAPALWRRYAAYAVAGLQTHLLQNFDSSTARAFLADARGLYGLQADLAIARDAEQLPRWNPLMSSVPALWGQLWFRFHALALKATQDPSRSRLEGLFERMTQHIRESDAPLAFLFPGLHEGARSDIAGAPIAELAQTQIALAEAESDQVLLRAIANCSLLCPATPQMAQSAARLTIGLQPNDIVDENGEVAGAVTALAYLLAALNDAENAKLLVGKLLLAGPTLKTSIAVIQAAHTLVVLASAHAHTSERQTAIEVGVSAIAFGVETGHCATGLLHLIDAITAMEPKLRPGLAQARIASTLLQDAV